MYQLEIGEIKRKVSLRPLTPPEFGQALFVRTRRPKGVAICDHFFLPGLNKLALAQIHPERLQLSKYKPRVYFRNFRILSSFQLSAVKPKPM